MYVFPEVEAVQMSDDDSPIIPEVVQMLYKVKPEGIVMTIFGVKVELEKREWGGQKFNL